MKWSPFYKDTYYIGKLSYTNHRYMDKWRWKEFRMIVRPGPPWMKDFVVYPNYSMLLNKVNRRKKK